jgi:hypothetical protein
MRINSFTRIDCTLLTCDMYISDLRHIHDPVLSFLKMKGIRLLFYNRDEKCLQRGTDWVFK